MNVISNSIKTKHIIINQLQTKHKIVINCVVFGCVSRATPTAIFKLHSSKSISIFPQHTPSSLITPLHSRLLCLFKCVDSII
ncbi:hypothetical protein P8452_04620 [Trifolium repens]|nr:hypothetical protein P8452_04620 [Trifolium repens]